MSRSELMPRLQLALLGGFRVDGGPLPTRKAEALLAFLALPAGRPHRRDRLMGLLWGNRAEPQARHSLSQTLSSLRKALAGSGATTLVSDGDTLALDPGRVQVDVGDFEALVAAGTPDALQQAADLYQGELLEGFELGELAFEEWLLGERSRLHELALGAFERLIQHHTAAGDCGQAIQVAVRLLAIDPLQERVHRRLMELYASQGRGTAALKQYELCREGLRRELGIEPEAATQELYRQLQRRRSGAAAGPSAAAPRPRTPPPPPSGGGRVPVAVLPFANLSADPEQEYFSDGITEDITGLLARNRWLMVVARQSSFVYKGRAADAREVGEALGVRYLVEGSVRRAGGRIRVGAQLVQVADGSQLWTERYDRDIEDVFALQDEIARAIAAAIEPELGGVEQALAQAKPPDNLDAWDCHLRGLWHLYRFTPAGLAEAERLFERAIAIDPGLARAHAGLAYVYVQNAFYGDPAERPATLERALAAGQQAVGCDDRDAVCHLALGRAHSLRCESEAAVGELELAIDLNPSFAQAYFALGFALTWCGREAAAVDLLETATQLSPHDSHLWTFHHVRALALLALGDRQRAENYARKAIRKPNVTYWPFATLTATLGIAGKSDEAAIAAAALLDRKPGYSCSFARQDFFFCRDSAYVDRYVAGLRAAGIGE